MSKRIVEWASILVHIRPDEAKKFGALQGAQSIIFDQKDYIKQIDKAITRIPPSPPSIFIAKFRFNGLIYSVKFAQFRSR